MGKINFISNRYNYMKNMKSTFFAKNKSKLCNSFYEVKVQACDAKMITFNWQFSKHLIIGNLLTDRKVTVNLCQGGGIGRRLKSK